MTAAPPSPADAFSRRPVADHRAAIEALVATIRRGNERLPVGDPDISRGRCLGSDFIAPSALPPFDNSQMDGFAVRTSDIAHARSETPVDLPVTGHIAAGDSPGTLPEGQAWAVMTGAPIPAGADAVVPIEVSGLAAFPAGASGQRIRISSPLAGGTFIRRAGSDAAEGEHLLTAGAALTPAAIASMAAAGLTHIPVRRRLRVLVVATGSELRPGRTNLWGSIPDANTPGLLAVLRDAGAEAVSSGPVPDDPETLLDILTAHAPDVDLVVTAGGVSRGAHEVVREALGHRGVAFGTVAMQPGGPQGVGVAELGKARLPVIALPGNPVSALVSAEVFLRPALRGADGWWPDRPVITAPLATDVESPPGREQFRRGRLNAGQVELIGGPSSHLLASFARSTLLVRIPADSERVSAGELVEAWRIDI